MEENTNKLHFECTDEYPTAVISHRQCCGSVACPLDSRLNVSTFSSVRALRSLEMKINYIALFWSSWYTQSAQARITVLPANNTMPAFPS